MWREPWLALLLDAKAYPATSRPARQAAPQEGGVKPPHSKNQTA